MKICAVICEFNPFHNGHKHLLSEARKRSGCDAVLCIMSGNFVQRAEPSIVPKEIRTYTALMNGADFVIELPFIYATANAEIFSKGAIEIISQIQSITHIAFGCENENIENLLTIANIQLTETIEFKTLLNSNLKTGMSYPNALSKTTAYFAKFNGFDSTMCDIVLSKPNNLLAIEYLKQIIKQGINISPVPILRIGGDYNDISLKENYSSASAIRESLLKNELEKIELNVPKNSLEDLVFHSSTAKNANDELQSLIIYALRNYPLENLLDAGEGIENRLRQNAFRFSNLNDILLATKTKRYTLSRLKRLCLQALFSITKRDLLNAPKAPLRLLGTKESFKNNIKSLPESIIIQSKDYEKLNVELYSKYILTEEKAASVYSQIRKSLDGNLYSYKLVVC